MKTCTGCGARKPKEEFYARRRTHGSHRAGDLLSQCIECNVRPKVQHDDAIGYVALGRVWIFLDELARRIGQQDAARRTGVTPDAYRAWLRRRVRRVQRRHVRAAFAALHECREHDVWAPPKVGRKMNHSSRPLE